jgi:hypothetical protein
MNLIFATGTAARNELSQLSKVPNWLISHATSSPSLGQVDDSIIGTAELTRSGVVLNKYHAMLLFANTTILPDFSHITADGISGRDCFSMLLEQTPINFSRTSHFYDPQLAPWIKYDPTEIKVKIDQGKLLSGILDKKSIGKGARGGIYHIIANEFGRDHALDAMFNTQQIAIAFTLHNGFSIGMMDMMLPEKTRKEVAGISADIVNQSRIITERLNNGEIIPPIGKTVEEYFEELQINTLKIYDEYTEPVMSAVDMNLNNLVKLVMFGSKGKIEHLFNMVSNGGQKLINGERIRQQFGFKRTLPYFPRFDTSPESRGYIASSYIAGMSSTEYIPNAMASRFDLISKALTTAVTGYMTRKAVLNMQSIISNVHRWSLKNAKIIQFSYGEDYLDATRVERVKFPSAFCSTEALQKYHSKDYPLEFAKVVDDREFYRRYFKLVEDQSRNEMMSDEAGVPANVSRIVNDILREHGSEVEPTVAEIRLMVARVNTLCDSLPNLLSLPGVKMPDFVKISTRLTAMLCRVYLSPPMLVSRKITPGILDYICAKISFRYRQALIEPGTAVGTIAAQSFSEPLTQYMLDAHHRSASGGTSTNVTSLANDVLGVKNTADLSYQAMFIQVMPEFEGSQARVQEIANNIEVMRFVRFVSSWHIFYEKYGEPVHSAYKHEVELIKQFGINNPLLRPPSDLTKWCIRFRLNKTTLILKSMSIELIITKLRVLHPELYFVYSGENSGDVIIRAYVRSSAFKGSIGLKEIRNTKNALLNEIIRGVSGIYNANVVKLIRTEEKPDGSIAPATNIWAISTLGTNIAGVLRLPYIDRDKIHSNSIKEMEEIFGVEAGRTRVIFGLKSLVPTNYRHYLCYADEMSYAGVITSIEISGLKQRDTNNIMLRVGFGSSLRTIQEASINAMEDKVSGLGSLMVGGVPKHGTLYSEVIINREFVQANVRRPEDIILEGLFD